jgi:hypothetical protein
MEISRARMGHIHSSTGGMDVQIVPVISMCWRDILTLKAAFAREIIVFCTGTKYLSWAQYVLRKHIMQKLLHNNTSREMPVFTKRKGDLLPLQDQITNSRKSFGYAKLVHALCRCLWRQNCRRSREQHQMRRLSLS